MKSVQLLSFLLRSATFQFQLDGCLANRLELKGITSFEIPVLITLITF